MARIIESIHVNTKQMMKNMSLSQGQLYSSHILLALVKKGLSREDAYQMVQRVSHKMKAGEHLHQCLLEDRKVSQYLKPEELKKIFSGESHKRSISKIIKRVGI